MVTDVKRKQNIVKASLLILEIALLCISVNIMHSFNINRLNAKQIMNVAFDVFAMIVLIIVYISCIYGKKNNSSNSFTMLSVSVYCCVFFELGAWMVDGLSKFRAYNYIFNIGCNSMILVTVGMFFLFTCKSLNIELNSIKAIYASVLVVLVAGIIAELLNITNGFYYYIDKYGVYARNQIGSICGYLPIGYILGAACYIIIKKKMPVRSKGIYLSYIIVPFVVSAWYMITEYPPTFYVSTFLSVILIYANIYVDLGQENVKYELENAHKETELALQRNKQTLSQIRPHFIFNALGSIEELCVVDAKKAENAVHYFAKYLRANMDALGKTDMVLFGTELEHIHNYIWLEKMRFDDELDYIEDIQFDDFMIPILSIQPLVENAVKHGMMGKEEGTLHVKVRTYQKDNNYVIELSDDGCGFDTSKKKDDGRSHIGMSYTKTSIESKLGGTISIDSEIGKGTIVTVTIPCNQE